MQLNIYVPREKEDVVAALDEAARRLGRQKNEIVIEAIESYLAVERPPLGVFHLGQVPASSRDDLYVEKWGQDATAPARVAERRSRYGRRKRSP